MGNVLTEEARRPGQEKRDSRGLKPKVDHQGMVHFAWNTGFLYGVIPGGYHLPT